LEDVFLPYCTNQDLARRVKAFLGNLVEDHQWEILHILLVQHLAYFDIKEILEGCPLLIETAFAQAPYFIVSFIKKLIENGESKASRTKKVDETLEALKYFLSEANPAFNELLD